MEHFLASKITAWCMKKSEMSENQAIAVTYGIELIFDTLFKVIVLILIGLVFGRAWEVILSLGCFSLLRSCAGGLHMKTSLGCFSTMLFVCVAASLGAEFIEFLPVWIMVAATIIIIVLNKLYAPFFTENNPIENPDIIRKKNTGAVIISALLLLIVWVVPIREVKLLILIPVMLETLSILPCWHKTSYENINS